MELFLDTANVEEIKEIADLGILDGVTTNPTLVAQSGRDFHEVIHEICEIVDGPVSAEVISTTAEMMIEEGRTLAGIHKHVVVKCPCTPEGLQATAFLSDQEIRVNVTLIFTPVQALLAAKVGAAYVSPFIGRLDDLSQIGMQTIEDIRTIFDNYDFDTAILAASIRHPAHVLEAALAGADVATLPYKIIKQLYKHPLTDSGLSKFLKDWNQQKV